MSKFDALIAEATAKFESGFTSKSAQKLALAKVTAAYEVFRDTVTSACLIEFREGNRNDAKNQAYWDLPSYPHQWNAKKHEAIVRAAFDDRFDADLAAILPLVDLRNAIKGAPVVKVERQTSEREVAIQKSIREIMALRKSQFERGLKVAELFGGLPVSVNVHLVTNQHGTTFLRAFWYLCEELTPLNVIIAIAEEADRRKSEA